MKKYIILIVISILILIFIFMGLKGLEQNYNNNFLCSFHSNNGYITIDVFMNGNGKLLSCFYESIPEFEYDGCKIEISQTRFHGWIVIQNTCKSQYWYDEQFDKWNDEQFDKWRGV